MSTPFKMKRWSGYQKPSPVQQDPTISSVTGPSGTPATPGVTTKTGKKSWSEVKQDFKELKEDISKKLESVKSGDLGKKIKGDIRELGKKLGFKEKKSKEGEPTEEGVSIETLETLETLETPEIPDIDVEG